MDFGFDFDFGNDLEHDGIADIGNTGNIFGHQDLFNGPADMMVETHANIFAGQDAFYQGNKFAETRPNIFGGHDTMLNGIKVGETHANIFGSQDIYQDGIMTGTSKPNIFGGNNIKFFK